MAVECLSAFPNYSLKYPVDLLMEKVARDTKLDVVCFEKSVVD
jgi:hypothetical protein